MKYIKSLLQLKKNRELPKEILYTKMNAEGWSSFKDRKRDKVTDFEVSEIKRFLKKIDIPCKHGKMCPTCPDAIVSKKSEMNSYQSGEVIEIKRSKIKYEIRKYVDEWYTLTSGESLNIFRCDTMDGIKQILKKISTHEIY